MPIPVNTPEPDERLDQLLQAETHPPPIGLSGVFPCPFETGSDPTSPGHEPTDEKLPIRLMLWHLFEWGGGFHMPRERPGYVIEACAELIRALKLHVIVLQGLSRTTYEQPRSEGGGEAAYIVLDPEPEDTGVQEVRRLLARLGEVDAGAGWRLALPTTRAGKTLYHRAGTAAFLYAGGRGIGFSGIDIVEAPLPDSSACTDRLLAARFTAPAHQSHPLTVLASLGLATPERPWERLRVPAAPEDLAPTSGLPDSALAFLSLASDTPGELDAWHDALDAEFQQPTAEGSVLADEFWKTVSETHDGLLGNFTAVNHGNLLLQDREMHWEALTDPEHTRSADRLAGHLAEGMAVLHHRTTPPPVVQELRVVDLVAASLPPEAIAKLKAMPTSTTADGGPPPELSVLVAQRQAYREAHVSGPEPEDDPANTLSECGYFSRMVSRHWPLVAQLLLEPKA